MGFKKLLFGQRSDESTFVLPKNILKENQIPTLDARKFACVVQDFRGMHVEVSGQKFPSFDLVAGLDVKTDATNISFVGLKGDQWFVWFAGNLFGPYHDVGKTSPVVSHNSKKVAYSAAMRSRWYAFIDGKIIGGPYEGFSPVGLLFSPDSQRVAYVIKRGRTWIAVVDGQEQEAFFSIAPRSWVFSPDSKRFAFLAFPRGYYNGNEVVGESCVVVDGKCQPCFEHSTKANIGLYEEIYFSPDSKRLAYCATNADGSFFIVDGVKQKSYKGIVSGRKGNPEWAKHPHYGRASHRSDSFTFSPDSRHSAYAAEDRASGKHLLIYNSEEKNSHDYIANAPIVFSPDSQRIAYGAAEGSTQFMVLDWTPLSEYYGLTSNANTPRFSSDSEHVAFIAMRSPKEYIFCIDGESWMLPGCPILGGDIVWDSTTEVHTLVTTQKEVQVWKHSLVF
jgi:hypothetical protein